MEESVQAFDIKRMLVGDLPLLFLVEIFVRTTVIYAYALTLIRWLGSRIVGQLSMVEFFLVIALGSAVGDPMFYHDVPMIHTMVVITVIVLFNRALDFFVFKSSKAGDIIEGKTVELVRNGIIQHQTVGGLKISNQELFQLLRGKGVENVGDVRAAYFEPDGTLSVFKRTGTRDQGWTADRSALESGAAKIFERRAKNKCGPHFMRAMRLYGDVCCGSDAYRVS